MQYSPKLKVAMEEIKQILKKHDIAAFVTLHTPGFSEYHNEVSPSYSCARLDVDPKKGEGVRVRLKTAEVGAEKARQLADGTYNMISHMADIISRHAVLYMDAEKMLQQHWGGHDTGGAGHTGHSQQNS